MDINSSTSGEMDEAPAIPLGKNQVIVSKPLLEYVPVTEDGSGRPSIFRSVRIMALLESAYKIGATHGEAALHAGLATVWAINHHIKHKSILKIIANGKDTGETITFPELVDIWKGNLTLTAKNAIYASIASKNTQDSWRVLERKQRAEWGLQAGQVGVDGGGGVEVNIGAEAMARSEKYQNPPDNQSVLESGEPNIHPTEGQVNAESAIEVKPPEVDPKPL